MGSPQLSAEPQHSRRTAAPPAWLPFAALNLSRNPFGELTRDERSAAAVVDVVKWADWLGGGERRVVQFMGDCGRGKTTHLLALSARLAQVSSQCGGLRPSPSTLTASRERGKCGTGLESAPHEGAQHEGEQNDSGYVYLPEVGPLPPIPQSDPLLIDEAQRLPWRLRRRVFRRGATLVLGTHRNLQRPLRRAGYDVRTVSVAGATDPQQICAIVNRRIELARIGPGSTPQLSDEEAQRLCSRFGDDIRAMEGYLYEQLQRYAGADHGQVRFVD